MTTVLSLFLITIIGIALFIIGKCLKDSTIGIIGATIVFLLGANTLMNPVSGIEDFLNLIIGSCLFGAGAYVFIRAGLESINEGSVSDDI